MSAPSASTSKPSLRRTVPPACRASSKSSSVRETLRPARPLTSREATGWSPCGNDEGGTGDRGDCCLKMCARMEDGAGTGTVGELASEDDPGGGTEVGARLSRRPRQGVSPVRGLGRRALDST